MTQCYINMHKVVIKLKDYNGCYKSGKRSKWFCVDILKCLSYDTCVKDDKNKDDVVYGVEV